MMTARITRFMAVLALTTAMSVMPAHAEDNNAAALKQQLDEVRRQLHELQFKVQQLESNPGSTQAPSPATVPSTTPPVTPAAATTAPSNTTRPAPTAMLGGAGASPSPAAVPAAFQWRDMLKDQWRKVKAGMGSEEIGKLLGKPSREFSIDGKPVWYYSYPGIGNGSVMFSRDGRSVAAWQHPPFGLW